MNSKNIQIAVKEGEVWYATNLIRNLLSLVQPTAEKVLFFQSFA